MTSLALDPVEVAAAGREEIPLGTSELIVKKDPGPDFGDAEITAYIAERTYGAAMIDYSLPPRKIVIPLVVKSSTSGNFDNLRHKLQAKCSRINEEGGTIKKVSPSGRNIYADVFQAKLRLSSGWFEDRRNADLEAVLEFDALPDLYGDLIAGGSFEGTAAAATTMTVKGNLPGRVDFTITEKAAKDQLGLGWFFRARNYSSAATASWDYEAEALTKLDTAAESALAGASGGNVIKHSSLGTGWTPILSTNLKAGTYLTHVGLYDVWARVYTTSGESLPYLRLIYDVGDIVAPSENEPVQIPNSEGFYLVNLGQINLRQAPFGTHRWQGIIQGRGPAGGENVSIDRLWFFNADESSGILSVLPTVATAPAVNPYLWRDEFNVATGAATGKAASGVGGVYAAITNSDTDDFTINGTTDKLERSTVSDTGTIGAGGFKGRAIGPPVEATDAVFRTDMLCSPSELEMSNIRPGQILNYSSNTSFILVYLAYSTLGWLLRIAKPAGTLLWASNKPWPLGGAYNLAATMVAVSKGSKLTIYLAGEGEELTEAAAVEDPMIAVKGKWAIYDSNLGAVPVVRQFDNAGLWVPQTDAVIYASQDARLGTDALYRRSEDGAAYGPIALPTSDLPRIPVSGREGRSVQVGIKPSRGNFRTAPDAGLDAIKGQLSYRPCWSYVPEE